ncbi:ATP-grasp domain-containing protein [Pediococcus pentosaceus]
MVLYESELIDIKTIQYLQQFVSIPQGVKLLELNQDRILERATLEQTGIKGTPYVTVVDLDDLYESINEIGYPAILRPILKDAMTEKELILKSEIDIPKASVLLERGTYMLQPVMTGGKEIAVSIVKDQNNRQKMFPMVENVYENHFLKETKVPVDLDSKVQNSVLEAATKIAGFSRVRRCIFNRLLC